MRAFHVGLKNTRNISMLFATIVLSIVPLSESNAQTNKAKEAANPEVLSPPSEGGARRWQVVASQGIHLYDAPSSQSRVVGTTIDGAILSNLGCTEAADDLWCEVRPLRGGVRGFVEAEFLVPARGPDGVVPMGVDDSERRTRKRDFDATGTAKCAQEKGEALGTVA